MNGNKFVLDTNIVLYLLRGDDTLADFLDGEQGYVSVITELELLGYPNISEAELTQVKGFLASCTIEGISEEIKTLYAYLRRRYRLKLGDAVVAATAIALDLPFMTADKDFEKVVELRLMRYSP